MFTSSSHGLTALSSHPHHGLLSLAMSSCRLEEEAGPCGLPSPSPCAPHSILVTLCSGIWMKEGPRVKNRVLLCKTSPSSGARRRASGGEFSRSYDPKITSSFILTFSSLLVLNFAILLLLFSLLYYLVNFLLSDTTRITAKDSLTKKFGFCNMLPRRQQRKACAAL